MLRLPAYVQFEITDKCNLRCKHCYHFDTDQMPKSMDLAESGISELTQKLIKAEIFSLVITGGEPLTRPDITLMVAGEAKKAGISTSINTNLLLLTPQLTNNLKELEINSLLVSCPASDPNMYQLITRNGNFNRFKSKINLLLNAGISCIINMVVTKMNCHLIKSTATEMARLGVRRFSATPAGLNVEHPNTDLILEPPQILALLEDLRWCNEYLGLSIDSLEPLPKCFYPEWCWQKKYAFMARSCQAGRMSASVSNIGEIRSCAHNPMVYGNLFEESLETIWVKMQLDGTEATPDFCRQCATVSICNGACRMNALAISGELNALERLAIGHIKAPIGLSKISIKDDAIVRFNGTLRFRKEMNGAYSIVSKNNGRNLIIVNNQLFRFVEWLPKILPLTFAELSKRCLRINTDEAFCKIIHTLLKKEFIQIS